MKQTSFRRTGKTIRTLTAILLLLALLLAEAAASAYVVKKTETVGTSGRQLNVAERLSEYVETGAAQVQADAPLLEKTYTLDPYATKGPAPDRDGFGATDDPAVVQAVVEQAADLLDGQTLNWSPDIQIKPGSKIQYYYDETILAIVWKEVRKNAVVTFAEIKLADASQLLRRVAQDKVGNHNWQTPTKMSKDSNAVVAISGDFYLMRGVGVSVYQGELYRNEPVYLDHCFVDYSGNLILTQHGTLKKKEVPQFVEDNDVNFCVAFGPILVQDGVKQKVPQYSLGEINDTYARAAIGQVDELHYILMTINSEGKYGNQGVIADSIKYMYEMNCRDAYALDGGRTASLTLNGKLVNTVNHGGERTMSDIISFVSAIPEDER